MWFLVDHLGADFSKNPAYSSPQLRKGDSAALLRNEKVSRKFLPEMLEHSRNLAAVKSATIIARAMTQMQAEMTEEITRLRD